MEKIHELMVKLVDECEKQNIPRWQLSVARRSLSMSMHQTVTLLSG